MRHRRIDRLFVIGLAVVVLGGSAAAAPQKKPVNRTAAIQADFRKRVAEYDALQQKLEAMLPKLGTDATPQQIDQHQRALGDLVAMARANAKPGDLFTPDMQRVVRRLFLGVFKGAPGREAKKYIHDEPHPVTPEINKRYPDNIPLSTMPPRVLAKLPKLPDELEYRFIANHLIIMDVHAHIMLDYVLDAIPADPAAARDKAAAPGRGN